MTPKEYLNQIKRLYREIIALIDEVSQYEAMTTKVTPVLEKLNVQSSQENTREDAMIKYIDKATELKDLLQEYFEKRSEIFHDTMQLKNADHITLLHMRYFEFKSWEDVADDMGYSIRWVYKTHGDALEELKEIVKDKLVQ